MRELLYIHIYQYTTVIQFERTVIYTHIPVYYSHTVCYRYYLLPLSINCFFSHSVMIALTPPPLSSPCHAPLPPPPPPSPPPPPPSSSLSSSSSAYSSAYSSFPSPSSSSSSSPLPPPPPPPSLLLLRSSPLSLYRHAWRAVSGAVLGRHPENSRERNRV